MGMLLSGLADAVEDDEDLARFLTSSRQYNAVMAKPAAFLPNPKDHETSVFRHGLEPRQALWTIGLDYVVRDRPLYGAAIFKARAVREAALEVLPTEPPPRHASIVQWPWLADDPDLQRARQTEHAALIAQHAALVLLA